MKGLARIRILAAITVVTVLLRAQNPVASPENAETSTHDAPVTFESKVTLVPVPVVVRDKKSHAVGNLSKDNFEIYDNGKPQIISKFSLEKGDVIPAGKPIAVETADGATPAGPASAPVIADRFVAYVFDDVHLDLPDLMQSRQAALKHFDSAIGTAETANTRAAVFATSGIKPEDFTSDRPRLDAALNRLLPHSTRSTPQTDCPYLSHYTSDLIVNRNDTLALQAAVLQLTQSCGIQTSSLSESQALVNSIAQREVSTGEYEAHSTITVIQNMVKRIAAMPGQRTLVLVSPGFLIRNEETEISKLIDLAIRLNVVINAIDGRGLYVDSQFDASRPNASNGPLANYEREGVLISADVLGSLAEGTGGTFFQNNNDLVEGFRRTGSPPEFTYMLGFSPQNLKNDGSFHSIKVKLKPSTGLTAQARRGYYAPKRSADPVDKAKQDIEDALFTREEMTDFPLSLNTQFFKSSDTAAKVSVVARVGLKKFHFRKADGRNKDQVTVVTALFDRDGNFLNARQTVVDLRFRDENLEKRLGTGLAVRSSFEDVKPGIYVVRLVVRDSEGQMISATNGAIEVP